MAVLSVTGARGGAPEPPADVSALDEVQVVPIVAARPHQDAEEVQVVAEVLHQGRPGAAETGGDVTEDGVPQMVEKLAEDQRAFGKRGLSKLHGVNVASSDGCKTRMDQNEKLNQ